MYSATFALTVIIFIAVTNLFLGFASAVLIGRGPKRWSDVDRAIVLRSFPLNLILPRRQPKVERINVPPGTTPVVISTEPELATTPTTGPGTVAVPPQDHPSATSTSTVDAPSAAKKFVLSATPPAQLDEQIPPQMILNRQVDAWREGDLRDEIPSLSGLSVEIREVELEAPLVSRLMSEIGTKITRQLRKDRRVLTIASHKFAWFSPDVSPRDALMPVERIRQMLNKTRFHYQGERIPLVIVAGVVSGSEADDAADLVQRLERAMACARKNGESPTYLDEGNGPGSVTPFTLEIEETECEVTG